MKIVFERVHRKVLFVAQQLPQSEYYYVYSTEHDTCREIQNPVIDASTFDIIFCEYGYVLYREMGPYGPERWKKTTNNLFNELWFTSLEEKFGVK